MRYNRYMRFTGKAFLFLIIPLLFFTGVVHAGNIDATDKFAEFLDSKVVAPKINFGTTEGDVTVTDSDVTGYAWSAEYGWINLDPANGGVLNNGSGTLSGYAWGEGTGWINFNPTNGGVTINTSTGIFSGYAWSQNLGWISFNCADEGVCGTDDYKVKTSWPGAVYQCNDGIDNDGDGLTDFPNDSGCDSATDDDESNGGGGGGGPNPDPDPDPKDTNKPVITVIEPNPFPIILGSVFSDPGAVAWDFEDGNLTSSIVSTVSVDTSVIGTGFVRYDVTDSDGNTATAFRSVVVSESPIVPPEPENTQPVITVIGDSVVTIQVGSTFSDPGGYGV